LKQVKKAAGEVLKKYDRLDVLINNAGIMACPFALSVDGIESQFATNHVGHFLLTKELLPLLSKSKEVYTVLFPNYSIYVMVYVLIC
jgi:NAD(P)-dependent dehydrogenase (short-subunit alcohol dehydrogenase family)